MSVNLDTSTPTPAPVVPQPSALRRRLRATASIIGEPLWVVFCMFGLSLVVVIVVMKLFPVLATESKTTTGQLVTNVVIYALAVAFVLLPLIIRKVSWSEIRQLIGIDKPLKMLGISWAISAFVIYFLATVVVGLIATHIPGFDSKQAQDVGFHDVTTTVGYIIAFIGLVILPPMFEETLFRGYLFGRLRKYVGFWAATIVTSFTFGYVHGQWNVGLDTFVLSVFLCLLREYTGSLWASMVLHGFKNGLAYFFLFIGPLLGLNLL